MSQGFTHSLTVPLPVAQGGTGVTTSTGSGSTVLSASPTFTGTPVLATPSATSLTFTSTTGLVGTTTNDNAAAGSVGEFVSSNIAAASAISISSNTPKNLTSISLTAGDWDVWGNGVVVSAGNSMTETFVGISTSTGTQPDLSLVAQYLTSLTNMGSMGLNAPMQRISLSGTTTIYLVVTAVFSTSTATMYGGIYARRRR